jgi:hypothetical protein
MQHPSNHETPSASDETPAGSEALPALLFGSSREPEVANANSLAAILDIDALDLAAHTVSPPEQTPSLGLPRSSLLRVYALFSAIFALAIAASFLNMTRYVAGGGAFEGAIAQRLAESFDVPFLLEMPKQTMTDLAPATKEGGPPLTDTEFVALLVGLPSRLVKIHYEFAIMNEHRGTLDMWLCRDATRKLTWRVRAPDAEGLDSSGVRLLPEHTILVDRAGLWGNVTSQEAQPWIDLITPGAHFVALLAQAYRSFDASTQKEIARGVATWREELVRARAEVAGPSELVASQPCLVAQWASQTACIWEEGNALLRYEGPRFALTAQTITMSDDPVQEFEHCSPDENLVQLLQWQNNDDTATSSPSVPNEEEVQMLAAFAGERGRDLTLAARQSLESLALGNYAPLALLLAGQIVPDPIDENANESPL